MTVSEILGWGTAAVAIVGGIATAVVQYRKAPVDRDSGIAQAAALLTGAAAESVKTMQAAVDDLKEKLAKMEARLEIVERDGAQARRDVLQLLEGWDYHLPDVAPPIDTGPYK